MECYTKEFYDNVLAVNLHAAERMMPYIIDIIRPKSVVDIGCGRGFFLKVIKDKNPDIQILGIDGAHILSNELFIDKEHYYSFDLTKNLNISKKFDLAMSFEVAEHLEEEFADVFIDNITKLSDVIVFSAAIPQQGGTHHVNEQWASYWTEKFRKKGYKASDCLRKYFWEDASINPLRRQNIMLYVKTEKYNRLIENFKMENKDKIYDVVHPDFWLKKNSTSLQRIEELNSICSTQRMMINSILDSDVDIAMKIIGEMNLFQMADNVKYLEYIKRHFPDYFLKMETEVDRVSKRMQSDKFILWGAGEDGKKVECLFSVIEKI